MAFRCIRPLSDDKKITKQHIADHQKFLEDMIEQKNNKAHAQEILQKHHLVGISVIHHWTTIIQSGWEDHLKNIKTILETFNFSANLKKRSFTMAKGKHLRHTMGSGEHWPDPVAIKNLKVLKMKKA